MNKQGHAPSELKKNEIISFHKALVRSFFGTFCSIFSFLYQKSRLQRMNIVEFIVVI